MLEPPKGTRLARFDYAKLNRLWDRIKGFDALFADDFMRDRRTFLADLLEPSTQVLEIDEGILVLRRIVFGLRAEAFFIFLDHKLSAKTELIKDCLLWSFLEFELERIEVYVADYARAVQRFIERKLGFTKEGVMRNRVRHNGELIDMYVFGLLKDELMEEQKNG